MAKQENIKQVKKQTEKQFRRIIHEKLANAFAEYRNGMDEKDFQSSLKKASKILSKEINEAIEQKKKKEKKQLKKRKKKEKEFVM